MIGDQRKEVRYPGCVHLAAGVRHVVAFSHQSFHIGHVINLSRGGLQLEYRAPGGDPLLWETIDIFSRYNHQLYLLGIGCRPTYDMASSRRPHAQSGRLHTRVAGLRFGRLGRFQKKMLEKIIAHCAFHFSRPVIPGDSLLWRSGKTGVGISPSATLP